MASELPTLLVRSSKSSFRLRVISAAWSDQYSGTYRPGLLLLNAVGPDTAIKAVRACLYMPELECEFTLESPDGTVERLNRPVFEKKPVTFSASTAKLAAGAVHLIALAKIQGLCPVLSDDHLWAELNSPRYTTPILRHWVGFLKRKMMENGTITMCQGIETTAGILTADSAQLDEMVSQGVRCGHLKMIEPAAANAPVKPVNWQHGTNDRQEFYHPAGTPKLCVCRNNAESHWVIYDLRGDSAKMIPNPNAASYAFDTAEEAMRVVESQVMLAA